METPLGAPSSLVPKRHLRRAAPGANEIVPGLTREALGEVPVPLSL